MRFIGATLAVLLMFGLGCKPPEDTSVAQQDPDAPVETELVKAEAGVGKQGQVIGNKDGFLRTPAKAFFKAKQQLEFLKVQHALNLYDAEHGFKPETEEEFMEKIIKFNNIVLPELPEGQIYVWDGEAGELMVEKPKMGEATESDSGQ